MERNMDESRKAFEQWFQNKYKCTADTMKVMQIKVELAWEAWQASREEIELKAPESISTREALDAGYSGDYAAGRDGGLDDWERIIRAAGIKVKE